MNPFLLPPTERLARWKEVRASLTGSHDDLGAVARYWAQAPLAARAYRPDPVDWGTPWEMIAAGRWCRDSVAVGMEFTLRLGGWPSERLTLIHIRDRNVSDIIGSFMLLKIDDETVLNYSIGTIHPLSAVPHDVIASWRWGGRDYQECQ